MASLLYDDDDVRAASERYSAELDAARATRDSETWKALTEWLRPMPPAVRQAFSSPDAAVDRIARLSSMLNAMMSASNNENPKGLLYDIAPEGRADYPGF